MDKPEGISQEIWDVARTVAVKWQSPIYKGHYALSEDIARAILKAKEQAYEEMASMIDRNGGTMQASDISAYIRSLTQQA